LNREPSMPVRLGTGGTCKAFKDEYLTSKVL
jgi:hypothetical protein